MLPLASPLNRCRHNQNHHRHDRSPRPPPSLPPLPPFVNTSGGFGKAWKARKNDTGLIYAIKIQHLPDPVREKERADQIERERNILEAIDSNVSQVSNVRCQESGVRCQVLGAMC